MYYEVTPPGLRQRRARHSRLSLDEKMTIVNRIVIGLESQTDLAKEYRVSKAAISVMLKSIKKTPEAIREAIHKRS
jgi:Trp operon repressor